MFTGIIEELGAVREATEGTLFIDTQASSSVPSTAKWSLESKPCRRASSTSWSRKRRATSWESSRSWFLEKVEAWNDGSSTLRSRNHLKSDLIGVGGRLPDIVGDRTFPEARPLGRQLAQVVHLSPAVQPLGQGRPLPASRPRS